MNIKKSLIFGLLIGMGSVAMAQPEYSVDKDVANMGEIMFQLPAKVTFTFKNTGNEPLHIKEVIPSCGCTTADWTREYISPGGEGFITAVYDAKMLGVFQKDLEVYTNASDEPLYLHMQGRVVSKLSDYSGTFPVDLGNVRMNIDNIEFDNVNKGDSPIAEIQIVNMSRKSYKPQLMHLPPYLTAEYYPEVLNAGRLGKIILTLDSRKLMQMGLTQTSVYLARHEGDKVGEDNEITVSSVLLPDFSSLSAKERELAPVMVLSADTLNMPPMEKKRKRTETVYIENKGKTPLEIRSIQVFNKSLNVTLSNRVIQPGEKEKLKITVLAKYLKTAKNTPRVLLITNDPSRSKEIITINVKP